MKNCGRSSGRSRIGTCFCLAESRHWVLRSLFGAIEDWNFRRRFVCSRVLIAVALRGDRGLELKYLDHKKPPIGLLRSLFGAIEDWNRLASDRFASLTLRSLFGAIEDWNLSGFTSTISEMILRSLFGAIEDWNRLVCFSPPCCRSIAVALRGDRGLELISPSAET